MQSIEGCAIRSMAASDLHTVLAWRNHPDVSRYMLSQHAITLEEHTNWFLRASNDPSRRLLIVEEGATALGFVHFSGVSTGGIADWGFYAAPGAIRGSGRKLGVTALNFAFGPLQLHKVCGQALGFNEASIRFHRSLGFQQEGVLREQHFINSIYHDMVCFGLLRTEWLTHTTRENDA